MAWYDEAKKIGNATINPVKKLVKGDVKGAFNSSRDASVGNHVFGGSEGVAGKALSGDVLGASDAAHGHSEDRKKTAEEEAAIKASKAYDQGQGYNTEMDQSGQKYLDQMDASHNDAKNTYTNTIQPNLKNLMEKARNDSSHSMSLQDAMDPNNAVASQTRALYERQAANEGRQGLADTGMLQAMGMQSMGNQMSGMGPMTGGQLAAMMGQNQAQSGAAFAKTQQRMQSLRDQGIDMGYRRSDQAYNQGVEAQDRYGRTTSNYDNAAKQMRAEDEGNHGLHNAMTNQSTLRRQALDAQKNGSDMAAINAQIAGENANQQQQAGMITAGMQAAGTAAGAYFGGPAGAKAGSEAGKALGDQASSGNDMYGGDQNIAPNGYIPPDRGVVSSPDYVSQSSQNPGMTGRQGTRALGASGRYSGTAPTGNSNYSFAPRKGVRKRAS